MTYDVEAFRASGYAITSRKFLMAARIDRQDWIEWMAKRLHRETSYIMQNLPMWANHYRRCYSRDKVTLKSDRDRNLLPKSGSPDAPCEFVEKM